MVAARAYPTGAGAWSLRSCAQDAFLLGRRSQLHLHAGPLTGVLLGFGGWFSLLSTHGILSFSRLAVALWSYEHGSFPLTQCTDVGVQQLVAGRAGAASGVYLQ